MQLYIHVIYVIYVIYNIYIYIFEFSLVSASATQPDTTKQKDHASFASCDKLRSCSRCSGPLNLASNSGTWGWCKKPLGLSNADSAMKNRDFMGFNGVIPKIKHV